MSWELRPSAAGWCRPVVRSGRADRLGWGVGCIVLL